MLSIKSILQNTTIKAKSFDLGGLLEPATPSYSDKAAQNTTAISHLETFISNLIGFMTTLAGLFFIIYFIMAAFNWVTAGDNASNIEKARNQMLHGVLGMIIIVAAYAIIGILGTIIGFNFLTPGKILNDIIP